MDESATPAAQAELIIPPARGYLSFRAALCLAFALLGVALMWPGFVGLADALRQGTIPNLGSSVILTVIGGLAALMFGSVFVQTVRELRSPGLRLTTDGYELNGRMRAWTDVEGFQLTNGVGLGPTTHILVKYAHGAQLSPAEKRSKALGRLGFYSGPAYIARGSFNAGGPPLERILRQWWRGDGDTTGTTRPHPGDA